MCMFSGPPRVIERVSGTNILARSSSDGRQVLVYSMTVAARAPVAMILPLPVPAGSAEAAVRFIDLKGYPTFFGDLDAAFSPLLELSLSGAGPGSAQSQQPQLKVHDVGDFVASPSDTALGDVAIVHVEEARYRPHRAGLACTVRAQQGDDLSLGHLDREAAQHQDDLVVDDFEVGDFEHSYNPFTAGPALWVSSRVRRDHTHRGRYDI